MDFCFLFYKIYKITCNEDLPNRQVFIGLCHDHIEDVGIKTCDFVPLDRTVG